MRLDGKVALVTGAGSGIGAAAARLFAAEGARVAALGHGHENTERTVAQIREAGGEAISIVADVASPEQVEGAVRQVIERWGRLDAVFANAGINGVWAPLEELSPEEWNRTLATNLTGMFLTLTLRWATAPRVLGSLPPPLQGLPEGAARAIGCSWPR